MSLPTFDELYRANVEDELDRKFELFLKDRQKSDAQRAEEKRLIRKQDTFRTEMCRLFLSNGTCRYGEACRFAHTQEQLRQRPRPHNYKTKLCLNYQANGYCIYGGKCQFIHRGEPDETPTTPPNSFTMAGLQVHQQQTTFFRQSQLYSAPETNYNGIFGVFGGYNLMHSNSNSADSSDSNNSFPGNYSFQYNFA